MSKDNEKLSKDAETATVGIASENRKPTPATGPTLRSRLANGEGPLHNFVGNTQELWAFTARMTGGDARKGGESLGEIITLKSYYCHNIEMENQKTGEIITVPRTALMDQNGTVFTFVSGGIVDALDTVRSIFGDGPYGNDVRFKVRQVRTRSGGNTYTIDPA
jgi:hypothetical protein